MKIAYHHPYPTTLNAYRTISKGFEHAFLDLGHEFQYFTPDDNFRTFFDDFKPDIFITATHFLYQKYIDLDYMQKLRKEQKLWVLAKLDFWDMPHQSNKQGLSEAGVIKNDARFVEQIKSGIIADEFFHVIEQGDERMKGFTEGTGYKYHTIPLAADKFFINTHIQNKFKADISFVGTNSSSKSSSFQNKLFPLQKIYNFKLYGQDWTFFNRILGWIQRFGQYFNLPILKSIRKPNLRIEDEGDIYKSSIISINIHESDQQIFGGDCNERTFKIPAFGGFQICDNVKCIEKYFKVGEEIIVAKNDKEWFGLIGYYLNHKEERERIIAAGYRRVLKDHTYHNRAGQILSIYKNN